MKEISYFSLRQYELLQVLRVSSQLMRCERINTPKVSGKSNNNFGIYGFTDL